jgi:hypothetical protein
MASKSGADVVELPGLRREQDQLNGEERDDAGADRAIERSRRYGAGSRAGSRLVIRSMRTWLPWRKVCASPKKVEAARQKPRRLGRVEGRPRMTLADLRHDAERDAGEKGGSDIAAGVDRAWIEP